MVPPNSLCQPAWSHSQPSHNRTISQIQAALLDPNSHLEIAGSSMYTGALDGRPLAVLAMARPASFPSSNGTAPLVVATTASAERSVMGPTAVPARDLWPTRAGLRPQAACGSKMTGPGYGPGR